VHSDGAHNTAGLHSNRLNETHGIGASWITAIGGESHFAFRCCDQAAQGIERELRRLAEAPSDTACLIRCSRRGLCEKAPGCRAVGRTAHAGVGPQRGKGEEVSDAQAIGSDQQHRASLLLQREAEMLRAALGSAIAQQ